MLEKNEQEQAALKEDIARKNEEKKKKLELKKIEIKKLSAYERFALAKKALKKRAHPEKEVKTKQGQIMYKYLEKEQLLDLVEEICSFYHLSLELHCGDNVQAKLYDVMDLTDPTEKKLIGYSNVYTIKLDNLSKPHGTKGEVGQNHRAQETTYIRSAIESIFNLPVKEAVEQPTVQQSNAAAYQQYNQQMDYSQSNNQYRQQQANVGYRQQQQNAKQELPIKKEQKW